MTDKVRKIREWVKARLDENASKKSLPQFYGMMEEDARFLDFLDSLQEEPVSEDLEKAAEQDVCEVVNCCSATGIPNDHIPSWVHDAMINEFIHGAEWKEQQMMKDAADGQIYRYYMKDGISIDYGVEANLDVHKHNFAHGDRIKVIIVKSE